MDKQNLEEKSKENSTSMEKNGLKNQQLLELATSNEFSKINNQNKSNKKVPIILIIVMVLALLGVIVIFVIENSKGKDNSTIEQTLKSENEYRISGNSLENFDLSFLKLENKKENKIYSPLSIKYSLAMLSNGADGNTKVQLDSIIGDYEVKKYINSSNMSFANAFFVNKSYENYIRDDYINKLKETYDAEVVFDTFETTSFINTWVSDKTLNLIDGILESISKDTRLILLTALGIDMEWEKKFFGYIFYENINELVKYSHERFQWKHPLSVDKFKFNNQKQTVQGMEVIASFNNYDIVKELGEDSIRETVGTAYREFLLSDNDNDELLETISDLLNGDNSDENINRVVNEYLDQYIKEINSNYGREDTTTDFSYYVDDEVKVFAKDLKEYNNVTLQYVGIMPITQDLDIYVSNVNTKKLNTLISNLKTLKLSNFKEGVVTKIVGFIPKFKFEYNLDLMKDLKSLGIEDVFDFKKSNLSKFTLEPQNYIKDVKHKANIEFTEDGIKAAAVLEAGGFGGPPSFDYYYDVPVEEIDISFDRPYMFLIRDKATGEVWFIGTVYNPLEY